MVPFHYLDAGHHMALHSVDLHMGSLLPRRGWLHLSQTAFLCLAAWQGFWMRVPTSLRMTSVSGASEWPL